MRIVVIDQSTGKEIPEVEITVEIMHQINLSCKNYKSNSQIINFGKEIRDDDILLTMVKDN